MSSLGVACFAVSFSSSPLLVSACPVAAAGNNGATLGERVIPLGQPVPKGGGYYQVGKPYQIAGVWYHAARRARL